MRSLTSYQPPEPAAEDALRLHCNEGPRPPIDDGVLFRQYPDLRSLRSEIAALVGRSVEEVVVTGGADDAIDRVMRAFAGPGATVVVPDPTFEMIPVYATQSGARVARVKWDGDFPADEMIATGAEAQVVALVTPDNPTGRAIDRGVIEAVATSLPQAVVLLDLAYIDYADDDLTTFAEQFDNIVVTRTFSKAWGLAGLRVGYALASEKYVDRLSSVGSPYPVSAASAKQAKRCLASPAYVADHVRCVRRQRGELGRLLSDAGAEPFDSQANFVFARFRDAAFVADALRTQRIEVRRFDRGGLEDALRIGCPGTGPDDATSPFDRLAAAIGLALDPDVLLFDMDGVLADVGDSYRAAIVQTCAAFGVAVTREEVDAEKRRPDSNDDFAVTRRMLVSRGVEAPIELVTAEFQRRYDDGLWKTETLLADRAFLSRLDRPLGIVTGRPRSDALRFLEQHQIAEMFETIVCREDAALKPDPAPVRLALRELAAESAWLVGDTVDDVAAARAADVLPIGVAEPGSGEERELLRGGAVRVIQRAQEVERWLK